MICFKTAYDTEALAKRAIKEIIKKNQKNEKFKPKKQPFRCYECRYCGKWHLTSMKKTEYIKNKKP